VILNKEADRNLSHSSCILLHISEQKVATKEEVCDQLIRCRYLASGQLDRRSFIGSYGV